MILRRRGTNLRKSARRKLGRLRVNFVVPERAGEDDVGRSGCLANVGHEHSGAIFTRRELVTGGADLHGARSACAFAGAAAAAAEAAPLLSEY